ncbi:hypothetical protein GSS87_01040 [Corynebacterium sp. 4HC-13]|uniref:hypothetical protein n=1 Tax=Corynebacterium anserum TaxID=2684406 RepID=UPI00163A00C9|nr:hypothetical protein [Corynebacterium anserum]MBC2681018.1 hypothetical protein [Corynebacterium anserum]
MRIFPKRAKTASVLAVTPFLLAGLAACGENSNESSTTEASTVTVTESVSESATAAGSSSSSSSSSGSAAADSGKAPTIKVDGNTVDNSAFTPVRCKQDQDDGHPLIEYEAGKDRSGNELDIDIFTDIKTLDSLDFDLNNEEWEVDDADKANATVTEHNGEYTVKATVTKDEHGSNQKKNIEVTLSCKA